MKKLLLIFALLPVILLHAQTAQNNSSAFKMLNKIEEVKQTNWNSYAQAGSSGPRALDTVYVGAVPHDTLVITGTYTHNGPIFVFNDGVLIFYHATVVNTGDVYVFQNGTLLADSSSLTFPQDYFYQRSLIVVQQGIAWFHECSFNYSGMQHSLVVGDAGQVGMESVHQNDWTTAGVYGGGTVWLHGVNLGGEYILSDSSTSYFNNVDTLLLWHKVPQTGVLNFAFPLGDTVSNYLFSDAVPGVNGVQYQAYADSCYNVMWGLMPVNGSDMNISNSNIRAVGAWFERGDSTSVTGVFNNTFYPNVVVPFTDRNIHLTNTFVQTWSLYAFDSSQVAITNCTLGEIGTQQKARILSQQFLLDGSGGYFWATDTSVIFASEVTIYSTARSERNGTFVLSYSNMPFSTPSSIQTSLFISVQNTLPYDPVPFDASTMWLQNIETPATVHADSIIPVTGSAWIDQGPLGSFIDFDSYSLDYQLVGDPSWTNIVSDSAVEIRHNILGNWNTNGLAAGNYLLRLVVKNNYADTVEAFKLVTLLPGITTGVKENKELQAAVFPNPVTEQLNIYVTENTEATIDIYNLLGQSQASATMSGTRKSIDVSALAPGSYIVEIRSGDKISRQRFIKK